MPIQYRKDLDFVDLVAQYNSLEKAKELLQADYEQQEAQIRNIKAKQEAEHQKTLTEFYVKKDDESAVTNLAKNDFGMLSKGQVNSVFKNENCWAIAKSDWI